LQPSVVHGLPSVQESAAPPAQAPPIHVSASVHALPSLQGALFAVLLQPLGPHASSVHGLPSSQLAATHAPPQHICAPAQLELRLQVEPAHAAVVQPSLAQVAAVQLAYWQPVARSQRPPGAAVQPGSLATWRQPSVLQLSTVQSTPSSQLIGVPDKQAPASQRSAPLHASASSHSAFEVERSAAVRVEPTIARSEVATGVFDGAGQRTGKGRKLRRIDRGRDAEAVLLNGTHRSLR